MDLKKDDLVIGDVVSLNSGGPKMTVMRFWSWGRPFGLSEANAQWLKADEHTSARELTEVYGKSVPVRIGVQATWITDTGNPVESIFDLRTVKLT